MLNNKNIDSPIFAKEAQMIQSEIMKGVCTRANSAVKIWIPP